MTTAVATSHNSKKNDSTIVIVGAGMAGLSCAKYLLEHSSFSILILEASNGAGGRIRRCMRNKTTTEHYELGAEFVHGTDTLLTYLMDWLYQSKRIATDQLEEHYSLSHADGGPDTNTTSDGSYGMYYVGGQLRDAHDPCVQPLTRALEEIITTDTCMEDCSIGSALDAYNLPSDLLALASASFGNTAGCTDLYRMSVHMTRHFERWWEQRETHGDYRPACGMSAIVQGLVDYLVESNTDERNGKRVQLLLNSPVETITYTEEDTTRGVGTCTCASAAVVVTVPPPMLAKLLPNMPASKQQALDHILFQQHFVKVVVTFSKPHWPDLLQSIICADNDMLIPEVWFQPTNTAAHVAVGFVTSEAAATFLQRCSNSCEQDNNYNNGDKTSSQTTTTKRTTDMAAFLLVQQLATVFNMNVNELQDDVLDCVVFDWMTDAPYIGGGYMVPRVGLTAQHLHDLAAPMCNHRIYMAGEATNANACCTIQAAMETGVRAAKELLLVRGIESMEK
jgi:monoamine oxidase